MQRKSNMGFTGIIISLLIFISGSAQANEYTCKIKNTLEINKNGYFVNHGWAANYENREFTVDRDSGKVIRTTALKQRLVNFNDKKQPLLINSDPDKGPYKVVTVYEDAGMYALLQINDQKETTGTDNKAFIYHTDIGMIVTGTCIEN